MPTPVTKQLAPILFGMGIPAVCLFGASGRWNWPNAWVLLAINLAAGITSSTIMSRNPDLLAERSNVKAGKDWDKPIVGFVVLLGPVATWITAGLDTRNHWSDKMPLAAVLTGIGIALTAAALIAWAMYSNRFFSSIVRIQKDRGHVVIRNGPYAYVRHPGYTGIATFTLVTPLILGSRWAFLPAAITAGMSILRTALEDCTLKRELEGYADYARSVKYRLIPLLW